MTSPYGSHFDGNAWPWTLDGDSDSDWFALHDATGRHVSDACVEGSVEQWREAADALRNGRNFYVKRLGVEFVDGVVQLCSPRNTVGGHATLPVERAGDLADMIDAALSGGKETRETVDLADLARDALDIPDDEATWHAAARTREPRLAAAYLDAVAKIETQTVGLRYGEKVCARLVAERDAARAEVERLKAELDELRRALALRSER